MSDEKLTPLPCPFCGSSARIIKNEFPQRNITVWYVKCTNTTCLAEQYISKNEINAIEKWNRRA